MKWLNSEYIMQEQLIPTPDRQDSVAIAVKRLKAEQDRQKALADHQNPHVPGAKLDDGKNKLGLVLGSFSRALEGMGEVGTFGARKYTPNGWTEVPDGIERYTDAMYRHLLKDAQNELLDPESQLPHLWHALWNLAAVVELTERGKHLSASPDAKVD